LEQAARLGERGCRCVVGGQQVGLFCGPLYTIFKAVSCLQVARDLGAVPIFWAATEDHDVGEVDHAYHLDPLGNVSKMRVPLPRGRAVEDIMVTAAMAAKISHFAQELALPEGALPAAMVGMGYGEVMIRLLVHLFRGTGLVILEPRLLRGMARGFFARELKEAAAINAVLKETTRALEAAGEPAPLDVGGGTNLFLKNAEGTRRERVVLAADGAFAVGKNHYTLDALLALVEGSPERFSTAAAARPLLQNMLLPVAAYVAGPTEIAYHRQLIDYHRYHGIVMPPLVPRLSATFVPPDVRRWMGAAALEPWREVPDDWSFLFEEKMDNAAIREALNAKGIPYHGLHLLRNLLTPHGTRQERVLCWWEFQRYADATLVQQLIEGTSWKSGHHYYLMM